MKNDILMTARECFYHQICSNKMNLYCSYVYIQVYKLYNLHVYLCQVYNKKKINKFEKKSSNTSE